MADSIKDPKPNVTPASAASADEAAADKARADTDNTSQREGMYYAQRKQSTPDSSYQNYLFGKAGTDEAPAWSDSAKGRFAIRMISRGIVGATFFAIGGRLASLQLRNYNLEAKGWNFKQPLQVVAKGIDLTLGRGIQKGVETIAGLKHGFGSEMAKDIGRRAITFRESRHFHGSSIPFGRTYGADIVSFTFDFAMASIGDAGTRSLIQGLDPNIKKTWLVNDQGDPAKKGERKHFLPGEWLKAVGRTSWRVLSKNQGEDWAAAIPYAFQMKFQRQFLSSIFNKRWNGHQLVFDHSWNGGAYRVNQQGQIVGDYQLVGALDLHARFVGYNWYTLMFREGYDSVGRWFNQWKENGYKLSVPLPEHFNPITTPIDATLQAARYATKSFIKANMYMNPAVIPFWLMRVPQSKWRGKNFIENEAPKLAKETQVWKGGLDPYSAANYEHYKTDTGFDRTEKWISKNIFNPIGKLSFGAGKTAANAAEKLIHNKNLTPKSGWLYNVIKGDQADVLLGGRRFAHEIVDASLSYTPYMYAKQEFGLRVDDNKGDGRLGQMDIAIYKFMDDVASFKFREIPDDLKKMWTLGTNFERETKVREGGGPDAQEVAKNAPTRPTKPIEPVTTVSASTIAREPANMGTAPEHGKPVGKAADAANDHHGADERSWAQSVVGSDIHPSRIHSGTATRH